MCENLNLKKRCRPLFCRRRRDSRTAALIGSLAPQWLPNQISKTNTQRCRSPCPIRRGWHSRKYANIVQLDWIPNPPSLLRLLLELFFSSSFENSKAATTAMTHARRSPPLSLTRNNSDSVKKESPPESGATKSYGKPRSVDDDGVHTDRTLPHDCQNKE